MQRDFSVIFNNACPACKHYGRPIYKRYSRLLTFHTIWNFVTIFGLGKNFLSICHLTMSAGLLLSADEGQN